MSEAFVDIQNLTVTFTGGRKPVRAVGGVDLQVQRGEVVALIGESGSGKSVTLRSLLRLHPPKRTQMGGQLRVAGQDVLKMSSSQLADYRGKVTSMIFQEPLLALDPVYTVGAQIVESIRRHENVSAEAAQKRALELFERVRIPSPERRLAAYPHEMSGGMRQRAMIALALACKPQLLLADEPTTALDVTIQAQVLDLMAELARENGTAVVLVTHDLGVVARLCDRVAVLYGGRLMEESPAEALFDAPKHPYSAGLLRATPRLDDAMTARLGTIPGQPRAGGMSPGCPFAPRCEVKLPLCDTTQPPLREVGPARRAACHLLEQPA